MLFHSEKFLGGGWVVGDIAIIESAPGPDLEIWDGDGYEMTWTWPGHGHGLDPSLTILNVSLPKDLTVYMDTICITFIDHEIDLQGIEEFLDILKVSTMTNLQNLVIFTHYIHDTYTVRIKLLFNCIYFLAKF